MDVVGLAILIPRVIIGFVMIAHGLQKFGAFGGEPLARTRGMLEHLGVTPAHGWAWIVALSELVGGVLLVLGFLSPIGGLLIGATLAVAILSVHLPKGLWNTEGGVEFPLVMGVTALCLSAAWSAAPSVDRALHTALPWPLAGLAALLAILGVVIAVATTRGLLRGAGIGHEA